MKRTSSTTIESRRLADVVERKTGEFFCQSGAHYARGESLIYRRRRMCAPCKQRLDALTKKQQAAR